MFEPLDKKHVSIYLPSRHKPFSSYFLQPLRLKFWNSPTLPTWLTTKTPPFILGTKCSLNAPMNFPSRNTFVDCTDVLSTTTLKEWKIFPGTFVLTGIRSSRKYSPFKRYPDINAAKSLLLDDFGGSARSWILKRKKKNIKILTHQDITRTLYAAL